MSFQLSSVIRHRLQLFPLLFLLSTAMVVWLAPRVFAQAPNPPKSALDASAMEDLPARLQAVEAAQRASDVAKIADANRNLLAVALRAMGELKLAEGDNTQAIDLYTRSLEFENTVAARIALALAYMRAQRIDDALAEVGPITQSDPKNADAWNLQGKLLMDKKQYRQAADSLTHSLELDNNAMVAFALATAYLNQHETGKAATLFHQINDATGDRASVHIMTGRAYQNAGRMDDAIREFNRAAEIDAKSSRAHYFLGLLYMTQNEWVATPQAREQFAEEVQANPKDFFGNFFLGYIENSDKNYDASDRYLTVAAADKPNWPEPDLYMGLNAYARQDNKPAEQLLRKAIALTGDDKARNNYQIRRAYYVLGRICIQTGRKDEGVAYTKIFSEMQDKTMADSRARTPASKTQGNRGNGMSDQPSIPTTAVIEPEVRPGDTGAPQLTPKEKADVQASEQRLALILGNAYNDLGASEARQKQYAVALSYFQQAEKWNPAIPHLMRNLGFAAFRSMQYAESARGLKVAVQQEPDDTIIPPMLAMALYSSEQYSDAARAFEQVGDVAYSDPRVACAWATSLAHTNQSAKAADVRARVTGGCKNEPQTPPRP
jgi:tetratricopeptide (TPR) repeat protein